MLWKFNGDSSRTLEYTDVHKHVEGQIGSVDITHSGSILQPLKWKLRVGLSMGPQALPAHSLSQQPNGMQDSFQTFQPTVGLYRPKVRLGSIGGFAGPSTASHIKQTLLHC